MLSLYMISLRFSMFYFQRTLYITFKTPAEFESMSCVERREVSDICFFSDQPRPQPDISTLGGPDILLILPI